MEKKTKKSKKSKKLSLAINIAVSVILVVFVLLAVIVMFTNKTKGKPTYVFGYAVLWVETGSMETTIPQKSYILVKKADEKTLAEAGDLEGKIITFVCNDPSSAAYKQLITHRVYEVTEEGLRTKGDNVLSKVDTWKVQESEIECFYVKNLKFLSVLGRFMSGTGIIFIIAIFVAICAFIYVPDIMKSLKSSDDKNKEEDKEALMARLVAEEVERMKKEKATSGNGTDGDKDNAIKE